MQSSNAIKADFLQYHIYLVNPFLSPFQHKVYELGWNWNDFEELSQGTLASHLLECGCQLTGGYFMHPGTVLLSKSLG